MSIYEILASKSHNPHYLNRYIRFIECSQQKNVGYDGYTESHHICPKATWPEYANLTRHPWNKALLTPRQHFIAHVILERTFGSVESKQALFMMSQGRWKSFIGYSKTYERLRQELFPIWTENGRRMGNTSSGMVVAKDKDGNVKKIDKADFEANTGALVGVSKGTTTVRDSNGNAIRVSIDDPRFLTRELNGVAHGKIVVKDKFGNVSMVSVDDSRVSSGDLVSISTGMMPAKDENGNVYWISNDDPRFLSGELVSTTAGETVVKDREGNTLRIAVDDPRLKTGELVGITSGTVTVRDKNGKCFRVPKDDPRYLSGDLVAVTKGVPAKNKGKVCYTDGSKNIFLPETSHSSEIPNGFYRGMTKKSQSAI